jgi:hypothetical protein
VKALGGEGKEEGWNDWRCGLKTRVEDTKHRKQGNIEKMWTERREMSRMERMGRDKAKTTYDEREWKVGQYVGLKDGREGMEMRSNVMNRTETVGAWDSGNRDGRLHAYCSTRSGVTERTCKVGLQVGRSTA